MRRASHNGLLERGMKSLGTLGSGNHFLELQTVGSVVDEATASAWGLYEDQVVAMIHSGSRGLGHQVCTDHVRQLESSYKQVNGLWVNERWDYALPDRQLAAAPVHSKEGRSYLEAMNAAANFAFANRAVLAERLRTVLKLEMGIDGEARTLYDVAHNIAKMETHTVHGRSCSCCVHRKAPAGLRRRSSRCRPAVFTNGSAGGRAGRHGERFMDHGWFSERKQHRLWFIMPWCRTSAVSKPGQENT